MEPTPLSMDVIRTTEPTLATGAILAPEAMLATKVLPTEHVIRGELTKNTNSSP